MSVRIDDLHAETLMNAILSKLTTLAAALLMNGLVMAGVSYLFALQAHPHLSPISFAREIIAHPWLG